MFNLFLQLDLCLIRMYLTAMGMLVSRVSLSDFV